MSEVSWEVLYDEQKRYAIAMSNLNLDLLKKLEIIRKNVLRLESRVEEMQLITPEEQVRHSDNYTFILEGLDKIENAKKNT